MSVPTIAQVRPGASVSIVLKADQRTGREVAGQVQDVLTRGNHPRGIKVRLQDGRIGRVQRMVAEGSLPQTDEANDGALPKHRSGFQEYALGAVPLNQSQDRGARINRHSKHRDMRLDGSDELPSDQIDLMAYAKPGRQPRGSRQSKNPVTNGKVTEISCPVCGDFKGDETAVAYHVETHFSES